MQNFNEIGVPTSLCEHLKEIGFLTPTPIQEKTIPLAIEGRDVLGSAQTGTGKTAAYIIPMILKLTEEINNKNHRNALILLPTRELADQVFQAIKTISTPSNNLITALLIGGESMQKQCKQLLRNPHIIVGTPGRINDHLARRNLKINNISFLVLDEADRMLDLGFDVQLDDIARYITSSHQTLMFSATIPDKILRLSKKYLTNATRVSVGPSNLPVNKIKQEHIKLLDKNKYQQLLNELDMRTGSVLVFVSTKRAADRIAKNLRKNNYKANALHGDLKQNKRNRVITGFRKLNYRILVATDVASRGLDIPHIEYVINYNLPQVPEDYIHRIGRTGRAGASGTAINFLSPQDSGKWKDILCLLNPAMKQNSKNKGTRNYQNNTRGQRRYNQKNIAVRNGRHKRNYSNDESYNQNVQSKNSHDHDSRNYNNLDRKNSNWSGQNRYDRGTKNNRNSFDANKGKLTRRQRNAKYDSTTVDNFSNDKPYSNNDRRNQSRNLDKNNNNRGGDRTRRDANPANRSGDRSFSDRTRRDANPANRSGDRRFGDRTRRDANPANRGGDRRFSDRTRRDANPANRGGDRRFSDRTRRDANPANRSGDRRFGDRTRRDANPANRGGDRRFSDRTRRDANPANRSGDRRFGDRSRRDANPANRGGDRRFGDRTRRDANPANRGGDRRHN